jgi:hypothetical protein
LLLVVLGLERDGWSGSPSSGFLWNFLGEEYLMKNDKICRGQEVSFCTADLLLKPHFVVSSNGVS